MASITLNNKQLWEIWYGFHMLPAERGPKLSWKVTRNKSVLREPIKQQIEKRKEFMESSFSKPDSESADSDNLYWKSEWEKFLDPMYRPSLEEKTSYKEFKSFAASLDDTKGYKEFEKELVEAEADYEISLIALSEFPDIVNGMAMELLDPIIIETQSNLT